MPQDVHYEEQEKEKMSYDLKIVRKDQLLAEHEALKFRKEADSIPELKLHLGELELEGGELTEKLANITHMLENANADNFRLEKQIDQMVNKKEYNELEKHAARLHDQVNVLHGDWRLLIAELSDAHRQVNEFRTAL